MTDGEMVKRCAAKMGIELVDAAHHVPHRAFLNVATRHSYWPLYFDEQAMALVKRLKLCCGHESDVPEAWWCEAAVPFIAVRDSKDLNRAIVECVAKMP